jgi:hypothetical protein
MNPIDDSTAIYILQTIGERLRPTGGELPRYLRTHLSAAFHETPCSQADLARAALAVLAEDPAYAEAIDAMARQGIPASRQRYIEPSTAIAATTAALLVLQTRLKFKAASGGKWSFEIEKKSAGDAAVKALIERLLSWLPK